MSLFNDVLTEVSQSAGTGGSPPKIATLVVPALEKLDDNSIDDFWKAMKSPDISHSLMAKIINSSLTKQKIRIGTGAVRKYRKTEWPNIFGPLKQD